MHVGDCGTRWRRALRVRGEHWRDGRIFRWVSIKEAPTGSVVYSHQGVVCSLYVSVCKCEHVCVCVTTMMHRGYVMSFVTGREGEVIFADDRSKNNLTTNLDDLAEITHAHYLTLEAMTSAFNAYLIAYFHE